jgi:glycosyltransferase involved in cell wall biosynthesis
MRVAFIAPNLYPILSPTHPGAAGGAERQFCLFGQSLAQRGFEVSYICSPPAAGVNATAFSVHFADFSFMGRSKLRLPMCIASLWKACHRADADYYLIKVAAHLLLPLALFCKLRGKRLVFWLQNGYDAGGRSPHGFWADRVLGQGVRAADIVIAQSEEQRRELQRRGIAAQVVPSIYQRAVPIGEAEPIDMLWVGNTTPVKRWEYAYEIARRLPHRRMAVAMNNCSASEYARTQEEASRIPSIRFLGMVSRDALEEWYRNTPLLLNTSVREGFPNTFLEAWAQGTAVLSLNVDPDGVIGRYGLGEVVNPAGDADRASGCAQMAAVVEKWLESSALRQRAAEAAKRYMHRHEAGSVTDQLIATLGLCVAPAECR